MVKIGNVESIGKATDYNFTLDDRQELIKTVNGAVVVDPWDGVRNNEGDTIAFKATFTNADAETVRSIWANRTRVNVTLDDGTVIANARVIVRSISFPDLFEKTHKELGVEIWNI